MRAILLVYFLLTFLALENEGHRDDSSANRFQQSPPVPTVNQNQFQFQRTSSRTVPQYRPIIAAYHPRVSNRQQFFSRNADHLLDDIEQPAQQLPPQQPTYVRIPQQTIRSRLANVAPLTSAPPVTAPPTTTTLSTTTSTTTTTTTTTPKPEIETEYEDEAAPVSTSTAKPNYRPRPVSVRTPYAQRSPKKQNPFSRSATASPPRTVSPPQIWTGVTSAPPVNNAITGDAADHGEPVETDADRPHRPKGGRRGGGRGGRKRHRSTTTTTTEPPLEDDGDYYDYDQEYDDDYDYQATTSTTTTTQRPRGRGRGGRGRGRGRSRGRGRAGNRRQEPTEPPTTTTTTTLSPNYKPRPDGRIIDYNADPNFPYELKGADLTLYPFYISIPENNFNCSKRHDGYYANIELSCQVYHHCASGHQRYDFLCPNYTLFDQTTFTCRFINTVDCGNSEKHYVRNNELYVESTTPEPKINDYSYWRPRDDGERERDRERDKERDKERDRERDRDRDKDRDRERDKERSSSSESKDHKQSPESKPAKEDKIEKITAKAPS